jgi:putative oxidoreductase
MRHLAGWGARLALAAGFLSAVADRLGVWGAPGQPRVAWGDWAHFVSYTGQLNWFVPDGLVPAIAMVATAVEVALAVLLLVGYRLRLVAYASAALLFLFAVAMAVSLGVKSPLDYSVFAAAAAALLLGTNAKK